MSEKVYAPDLALLAEAHFGRKRIQPSLRELHAFYVAAQQRLFFPVLWWGDPQRRCLADAFGDVVGRLRLTCYACAVLRNHVHLLVRRHRLKAEEMSAAFKLAGRQAMIQGEAALAGHPVFSADCCHVYKSTSEQVWTCVRYIEDNYKKHRLVPVVCAWAVRYDGWPLRR
jgi:hypothetical protein